MVPPCIALAPAAPGCLMFLPFSGSTTDQTPGSLWANIVEELTDLKGDQKGTSEHDN